MSTTDLDRGRDGERSRDLRIDFARGVALLFIFSDHIHENVVASFTPQALGFSDMAEVFVFLSGYVCGVSYGRRLCEQGYWSCLRRASRRALQDYLVKLAVTVAVLAIAVAAYRWIDVTLFGDQWTIEDVIRAPRETALGLLSSRLELHQFCVLALYIPLLLTLPVFLYGLRYSAKLMLAASGLLYALVQFFPDSVALPVPWRSALYFNPLAWQFLFFSAAALATLPPAARQRLRPNWQVALLMTALLEIGIFARCTIGDAPIPWTDKANLEWLRLLHFAAVLVFGWWIMPPSAVLARTRLCRPLIVCGSNSLVTYCATGVMGILGETVFRAAGSGFPIQIAVNVAGWCGCIATAAIWQSVSRLVRGRIHQWRSIG
jgi:hypothetical protein